MPDREVPTFRTQPSAGAVPYEPQGWPLSSHTNALIQSRQELERQRVRVEQLTRRNRRLRSVTASGLAVSVVGMAAAFGLGILLGYGFGAGLMGMVSR